MKAHLHHFHSVSQRFVLGPNVFNSTLNTYRWFMSKDMVVSSHKNVESWSKPTMPVVMFGGGPKRAVAKEKRLITA